MGFNSALKGLSGPCRIKHSYVGLQYHIVVIKRVYHHYAGKSKEVKFHGYKSLIRRN